jgi:hypothetical protein
MVSQYAISLKIAVGSKILPYGKVAELGLLSLFPCKLLNSAYLRQGRLFVIFGLH